MIHERMEWKRKPMCRLFGGKKLRPAFAFFAMRQLMKVKQRGKWRHALPARFQPDDLGKARRVNDNQEPTSHITRPAQFHPGHIRFAGEIAPESAIICISLKLTRSSVTLDKKNEDFEQLIKWPDLKFRIIGMFTFHIVRREVNLIKIYGCYSILDNRQWKGKPTASGEICFGTRKPQFSISFQ